MLKKCIIVACALLLGACNMEAKNTLEIKDTVIGTGAEAKAGQSVTVHYTGRLVTANGLSAEPFDSSVTRGRPFTFTLGIGQVIQGWDQGFAGMKIGGKRELTIPPSMAYGASGVPGAIPPNSTLHFDVELLGVD